jgi:hypothetical protein
LRNVAQCPVEMNLMPKSSLKRQQFNQKKPYFIATVFSLVAVVLAYGWFYAKIAEIKRESLARINEKVEPLKQKESELQVEHDKLKKLNRESDQLSEWLEQRFFWPDVLAELRRLLMRAEENRKEVMSGIDNGVWIESFTSQTPGLTAAPEQQEEQQPESVSRQQAFYYKLMMERYHIGAPPGAAAQPTEGGESTATPTTPAAPKTPTSTNEIAVITVKCRGLNLKKYSPTANNDLAYAVEKELQESPIFDRKETKLSGDIESVDESAVTFSFGVTLKLKHPMKL